MPAPFLTVFDTNGNPINNAKVCTYVAGTSTPATTYTDVTLTTPNTNPIRTDSAGRFVAFLTPGASYKVVYQDSTGTVGTCDGAILRTQDNISAVPGSSAGADITGTAGETFTAGQGAYLSDGSGGKSAGQWYKADTANTYSSTAATVVGLATAAIPSGTSGTFRITGSVAGLTSLTIGATYYAGTSGALTSTAPGNARVLGRADSVSSLVVDPGPAATAVTVDNRAVGGRLSLTTGVPVTTTDVTGAATIYWAPYTGNRVALYDGTNWNLRTFTQLSIALGTLSSGANYDIFVYDNSGTPALEFSAAWSSDTAMFGSGTYASIRPTQDGVYVKSTNGTAIDATRRYLGTFRTTATTTTEDSLAKRFLWNYYNRVSRAMRVVEATDSWADVTASWHQMNAAPGNQLDYVIGVAEVEVTVQALAVFTASSVNAFMTTAIGYDSTSAPTAGGLWTFAPAVSANFNTATAALRHLPAIGRHTEVWLGLGSASTGVFYGDNGGTNLQSGIVGTLSGG